MSHATTEYSIQILSPAGVPKAIIDQPRQLSYRKEVNDPGLLTFALHPDHHAIQYLELDAQIEVWRWSDEIEPYVDFRGLFRQEDYEIAEDGTELLIAYCPGEMDYLERAIVAYPNETANRNEFVGVEAETIMKTLVVFNATSAGVTGDGRIRNVDGWGGFITTEADGGGGDVVDFSCFGQNLLGALKNLAFIGGGDFNLVKIAAQSWEFRWYEDHLGSDVSDSVIFSLERGNILRGGIKGNTLKEGTVIIVGGKEEGALRAFQANTGVNYDSFNNSRESFLNASNINTSLGLLFAGLSKLEEMRAYHTFNFDIRQTESSLYGVHFNVGDLVRGIYRDFNEVKQIWSANVLYVDAGGREPVEKIRMVLRDV
jgi:hypothetical protein